MPTTARGVPTGNPERPGSGPLRGATHLTTLVAVGASGPGTGPTEGVAAATDVGTRTPGATRVGRRKAGLGRLGQAHVHRLEALGPLLQVEFHRLAFLE